MPSSSFSGAIAETFGSIERALTQIEERDERNSGIEAAVDDLYTSASVYVASRKQLAEDGGGPPDHRRLRLLREARVRLSERLSGAVPNDHARRLGLS